MMQIPITSKLHIYIVQLDLKVTSLSNKGQPLASSHSEVSPCRPYRRSYSCFQKCTWSCSGTGQNVLSFFPAARRWNKDVQ